MNEKTTLLRRGAAKAAGNKRYIVWFWLLNLVLAWFGTIAFHIQAAKVLDHSLYSGNVVHGFDLATLGEVFMKPEFGVAAAVTVPSLFLGILFLLSTTLLLPGVFQGYASEYRLPREDFFQACGRNLWRFVRLLIFSTLILVIVAGILFAIRGGMVSAADKSTNELLPVEVGYGALLAILIVLTMLRTVFDLAEADVVLSDQRAVRRSLGAGFRHGFRSLFRLTGSYFIIFVLSMLALAFGLWVWNRCVSPWNVFGAFVVGQLTLMVTLACRFWQRGVAVAYWQERMAAPVIRPAVPFTPAPVAARVVFDPPLPAEPAGGAPSV